LEIHIFNGREVAVVFRKPDGFDHRRAVGIAHGAMCSVGWRGAGGAESVSCRKMNYCNALAGSIATAKCRGKNRSLVHRIASTKISLLQAMNLQLDVNFCPDLLEGVC